MAAWDLISSLLASQGSVQHQQRSQSERLLVWRDEEVLRNWRPKRQWRRERENNSEDPAMAIVSIIRNHSLFLAYQHDWRNVGTL